jgi:molybdate transport system substrate-binding protein
MLGLREASLVLSGVAALVLLTGCDRPSPASGVPASGVIVFAVAGLTRPLDRIASRFRAETGVAVTFNLLRSDALAAAILSGETADLVLSDDEARMARLDAAGLIEEGSRVRLLSDRLVVIVPAASTLPFQVPGDLAAPAVRRFALSDPAADPAGRHAPTYLQSRGVWPALQSRVTRFAEVRAATTAVALGTANAAIVSRSDARATSGVRILLEIDEDPRWRISYVAAVLRRAPQAAAAQRFLTWMTRPENMKLFEDAGFIAAAPGSSQTSPGADIVTNEAHRRSPVGDVRRAARGTTNDGASEAQSSRTLLPLRRFAAERRQEA